VEPPDRVSGEHHCVEPYYYDKSQPRFAQDFPPAFFFSVMASP
jgi:hypothetical protein